MAKGKRITDGKTLVVYSTKVVQETRALLDALAKANGPDFGQRELLEEMIPLYMAANPEKAQKAQALLELLGWGDQAANIDPTPSMSAAQPVSGTFGAVYTESAKQLADAMGYKVDDFTAAAQPKTVQTVRYTGNPKVHLYEPGSKNSTGCGLAGTIDPESIADQEADAVTCGKCRYCRKSVFA